MAVSVLEELATRGGLVSALGSRDAASLVPVLAFLVKHAVEPRYSKLLLQVAAGVLDQYGMALGAAPQIGAELRALRAKLAGEIAAQGELAGLQGCLEPLIGAALLQQ